MEFELDGQLAPGLSYRLGYSYADARVAHDFTVEDYNTSHNLVGLIDSKSGDSLPNAPKQSATAALDYAHPLTGALEGWTGKAHLDASYRSSTTSQLVNANPANPPPFQIDAFSIWGASLGLIAPHGIHADLYVQNMFNALGVTCGSDRGAVGLRAEHFFVTRPRTIGLRIGYSF